MIFECATPEGERSEVSVDVVRGSAPPAVIAGICIRIGFADGGRVHYLDENHATALMQALQAAVTEVQARAVSR